MTSCYLLFLLPSSTPEIYHTKEDVHFLWASMQQWEETGSVTQHWLRASEVCGHLQRPHTVSVQFWWHQLFGSLVYRSKGNIKLWMPIFQCELKYSGKTVIKSFSRSSSVWNDTALYKMPYVSWRSFPFWLQFMNSHKPVKRSKNKCPDSLNQRRCFINWILSLPFLFMPGAVTAK